MFKRLIISGFGVIGTEVFHQIIKRNKFKKLHISIIEKNFSNFPGGVAYSKQNSRYGFFNNPLRISNKEFIGWVKRKKNIEKFIGFIKENQSYDLDKWLSKNIDFKLKKINKFSEIYFPRLLYSFFLEDKIIKLLNQSKKKKLILNFFREILLI